jgi:predicted DNA-binding transcriptional regulator AlpA
MQSTSTSRRMLRVREAAELTGLSVSYLNKLRVTGMGPRFRKLGRAVAYDPADVQEWLDRHSRASTSDQGGEA